MEDYKVLKSLLDLLFEECDLKSWTTHENKNGNTVTLRFASVKTATRETTNPNTRENCESAGETKVKTFKQKSAYQLKRDKKRMEEFHNERLSRSKTNSDTLHMELRRGDLDDSPQNNMCISPVTFDSTVSDTLESTQMSSIDESTPEDEPCLENKEIDLPKFDDGINSTLIYDHMSKHTGTQLHDIKCSESECAVNLRSVGVQIGMFRLIYCEKCDMYICTKCRYPGAYNRLSEDSEDLTHSTDCNYPACYVT